MVPVILTKKNVFHLFWWVIFGRHTNKKQKRDQNDAEHLPFQMKFLFFFFLWSLNWHDFKKKCNKQVCWFDTHTQNQYTSNGCSRSQILNSNQVISNYKLPGSKSSPLRLRVDYISSLAIGYFELKAVECWLQCVLAPVIADMSFFISPPLQSMTSSDRRK